MVGGRVVLWFPFHFTGTAYPLFCGSGIGIIGRTMAHLDQLPTTQSLPVASIFIPRRELTMTLSKKLSPTLFPIHKTGVQVLPPSKQTKERCQVDWERIEGSELMRWVRGMSQIKGLS